MIVKLLAESENQIARVGTHFRVIEAQNSFRVRFEKQGNPAQEITLERGMAFEPVGGFEVARLLSEFDQTIKIEIVNGQIYDNRLTGQLDYSGALKIIQTGAEFNEFGVTSVNTTAVQIRPENLTRKSLLIQADGVDVFVGSENTVTTTTGLKIADGGTFETDLSKAIYVIASGPGNVRWSEDYN